jgi:hypothetical protein
MRIQRWLGLAAAAVLLLVSGRQGAAQGLTTGAISGTVTDDGARPLENAQVEIRNLATGFRSGAITRANGRYFVQGLTVGGPYSVTVRLLGYSPVTRSDLSVSLGGNTVVDVQLRQAAAQLAAVAVTADPSGSEFSSTRQGVATVIADTMLRRIPILQRDYTDLVKLTPQVSRPQDGGGPSAGGVYNRFNNFTVDGVNQNDRFNLGSSGGQPGGAVNGRVMSLEAVKEFQVLMSPTDVRYGNFAGMLVNAVTRSGTNEFTGSGTYGFRNPQMAADPAFIRQSDFRVKQYGFSLGGPIIRDRLHFFIAPEWQERTDPAAGPSANSATNRIDDLSLDSIARIAEIMTARGVDIGSTGFVRRNNPLTNIFARLDFQLNDQNRFAIRQLYNTAQSDAFSRSQGSTFNTNVNQQNTGIRLTSNAFTTENKNLSTAFQFFTNLQSGISNELSVGWNTIEDKRSTPINTPEIAVAVTPVGGTTPSRAVTFGTERFSPGNALKQRIFEVSDNLTLPFGSHTVTLGGRFERTYVYNYFLSGAGNGAYIFPSISALAAGTPSGYLFSYANGGDIPAEFNGQQYTGYLQDVWTVRPNFTLTYGVRVDRPEFLDAPKLNQDLLARSTAAGNPIRTDWVPKPQMLFSPRAGFNWNVGGRGITQIRGNAGVFTSPVPYIMVGNAFSNTGLGAVNVACDNSSPTRRVPAFTTDVGQLPRSCANQPEPTPGAAGTIGVNVTDPNFKNPQNFTSSLGIDRRLPGGVIATFEGLYRRAINGVFVRDLNLEGPRQVNGADYTTARGRTIYADTITTNAAGAVTVNNSGQRSVLQTGSNNVNFSEGAIYLTNQSADYSYSLSTQLKKRFDRAFEGALAYTFMQAKDVQSLTSDRAISNYRNGTQPIGRIEDPTSTATSYFERPHRVVAYGTYTAPWTEYQTDFTFYYEGISGSPITYVTSTDINGDGVQNNDPIYIPRSGTDVSEVRIGTGSGSAFAVSAAAAADFERFISSQACLTAQRGQVMERNSCRTPWQTRFDLSVRQSLPRLRGQGLTLQLDIINAANLLNRNWGAIKLPPGNSPNFPQQIVLTATQRAAAPLSDESAFGYTLDNRFRSSTAVPNPPIYTRVAGQSRDFYQMQLSLRYSF